ncbi:MAG: hypothetical protein CL609_08280 [Anaerolineaceae bacterium]|nr:hypothetical protein [Anaerolineaceae bacterium]
MRTNLRFFNVVLVGVLVLTAILGSTTTPAEAIDEVTPDLFISEYVEGSSNNKAIEIYNPTGDEINLSTGEYKIELYSNGSSTVSSTYPLSGTIAGTDVFIFAQSSADPLILAVADQTSGAGLFNGDDAIILKKGDAILDVFGQVGTDPGDFWGSDLTATKDHTLRRKVDICSGDTTPSDAFDPSLEWDGFANNTFDGLGSHTSNCAVAADPVISEIQISTTSTDWEFIELLGDADTDLSAFTIIGVEGDLDASETPGVINIVIGLSGQMIPADGYWVATSPAAETAYSVSGDMAIDNNSFENGTASYFLVSGFTGELSDDLDTDDDGILDITPWDSIIDSINLRDSLTDFDYGAPSVGPDGTFPPSGTFRCPSAVDGTFDGNFLNFSVADGTPGIQNYCNSPIVPTCPASITIEPGQSASEAFSAVDADGVVVSAVINSSEVSGISISDIVPATAINETLTGNLVVADTTAEGVYSVELLFTNNDGTPQTATCAVPVTIAPPPGICAGDTLEIGSVQGEGTSTPFASQSVTVSGVVTSVYQGTDELGGFFLQDTNGDGNDLTSDGIFVYSSTSVTEGDIVQVTGTASERYGNTQISAGTVSQCTPMSLDLPTTVSPVNVSFPLTAQSDLEYYEGMLVTFPQDLTISEYFNFDRYGEIVLSNGRFLTHTAISEPSVTEAALSEAEYQRNKIVLDDGRTNQNPDPAYHPNGLEFTLDNLFRGGDTVKNVTGTIYYDFNLYRVAPTTGADYTSTNPRTTAHEAVGGSLKVASFNVLNYFTTLGSRGADTAEEFTRQRDKIIAAIAAIDADVVGLIEIENNTEAIADLVNGLNAYLSPGTYAYVDTGVIGTDEIKVAFIYKPATVSLVGDYEILDSSVDSRFIDTKNRPVLAQTFQETATGGVFTVAVNHLKSKGSVCDGDPDLGDGAGNCNLTRTAAAEALVDWLNGDPTGSGDPDFLIIGDLNSYDKEDPIDAILEGADDILSTTDDYTDLIFNFVGEDAYSYVFDGRIGYLDHALANQDLFAQVSGTTIWHINADEADLIDYDMSFKQDAQDAIYAPDPYRSSDHDPVIIGLSLDNAIPVANDQNVSVDEDDLVAITLTGSDQETASESLVFDVVDGPSHGVLTGTAPNLTYEPDENYFGPDSFTFTVNDGEDTSLPAAVTITVNPVNDQPIADSGSVTVDEDDTIEISLTGSDVETASENLIFAVADGPIHGVLTGTIPNLTYEPDENYFGPDSFTFTVSDGINASSPATVNITVNPVNDNPVAVSDSGSAYAVTGDQILTINAPGVLSNDSDVDGDVLTAVLVEDVSHGTLTLNPDGSFTYDPNDDYAGPDTFTYKATDGDLESEVVTVTIIVAAVPVTGEDFVIYLPILLR